MGSLDIQSNQQLQNFLAKRNKVRYLFFWGHYEKSNQITKACFSQWYESRFEINGTTYQTAEQYMMAAKAGLFEDKNAQQKIIAASNPGEAKKLGRLVQDFNEQEWNQYRFNIVMQGNLAKFSQNQKLKSFLLTTSNRILVEASPVDKIWGGRYGCR